jgi:hypothetical protein
MSKKAFKTLCDLKWNYPIFNMSRGEFRTCCRTPAKLITKEDIENNGIDVFLNSEDQLKSRLALINGENHPDCKSCWSLEDNDMKSPRHTPHQFWEHLKRSRYIVNDNEFTEEKLTEILDTVNDPNDRILRSTTPYMLEINIGNTCDMKCMYCTHHYSSQWGVELIKWGEITEERLEEEFPKAPANFDETFWQWFNQVGRYSISRIGIIGGEPLITPEFYVLLDKLIASINEVSHLRSKRLNLWVVTNLNTPQNYLTKFIDYLPKLSDLFDVSMYVSAESIESRAEYIRYGVKWDKFESNIHTILTVQREKNLNFSFNFMPSINVLSVASTKQFVIFVEKLMREYQIPIGITQNIISFPDWQSPLILTEDFAEYLIDTASYIRSVTDLPTVSDKLARWDAYADFVENLANSIKNNAVNTPDKTTKRRKFSDWFNTYDFRRKVTLLDVFPEYTAFRDLCASLK